jgi:hypothetical protein
MTTWSLDLFDLGGTAVGTALAFQRLTAKRGLMADDSIEVDLLWQEASRADWAGGERKLRLKRDAGYVWTGGLWRLMGDGPSRTFKVQGNGSWSWFKRRFAQDDLHFTDEPQQDLAFALLDHTQTQANGDLGITQGAHSGTSIPRSRWVCRYENIADSVEALTGFSDGFEFDIDPATQEFKTWAPNRGTATGITLTGSDEVTFEWEEDYLEALSYVVATDDDACSPTTAIRSDGTAIARFGRLEDVILVDSGTLSEVQAAGDEELRKRKAGVIKAKTAFDDDYGPAWGTYDLGDTLTVNVGNGPAVFNRDFRIVEISLSLEGPEFAHVELGLDGALV